jgi:hypothetical protein
MAHFTDLKLYWEDWSGYPERSNPFGEPTLTWILATRDAAARCLISAEAKGAMDVTWKAGWTKLPFRLVEPLPALLEDVGAFGSQRPLIADGPDGAYLTVWDLTGVVLDRTFHLSLKFTRPGERWTPLGERLRTALIALREERGEH